MKFAAFFLSRLSYALTGSAVTAAVLGHGDLAVLMAICDIVSFVVSMQLASFGEAW